MAAEARPRKFVVGGNWKMNGDQSTVLELCRMLCNANLDPSAEVVIGVPAIYIMLARKNLPCHIHIAGQNAYLAPKGAFTGEISPAMLKDVCANWLILGHSERRQLFGEADDFIAQKMAHATEEGLNVIGCIGETLEERDTNIMEEVLARQMCAYARTTRDWSKVVIAYEPIWAIGTGKTATPQQAQDVHAFLRNWLDENLTPEIANATRLLYGGSVSSANCKELAGKPDIDGFLVGGASLKPEFIDIINCNRL